MLLFNAHKSSQGFTLIEMLIVVAVIGVLAAISAPSFMTWLNRKKVESALVQVQGALKEAQREAIRKSQTCTVNIPDGSSQTLTASPVDCLVTGNRELSGIDTLSNLTTSPKRITFSFRGTTTNSGTIVLYMSNGSTQEKRCLAIATGIGIMRTGNYSGSTSSASDVTARTCTTTQ